MKMIETRNVPMKNWIRLITIATLGLSLISCRQEETDDLAKAQQCLDKVPQSDPGRATACLPFVAKHTSQQANILKCSIYMTSGGLTENKMVAAYKAVDDKTNNNREATFMSLLALNVPNVLEGYDTAVNADNFCQLTGVPGLQYISGIIKIGSFMAKTIGSSVNFDNPDAVKAAVSDLISKCNTDPRDAACPTDLSVIGSSASVLAEGYCTADAADSEVCENINAAVDASSGNPNAIGDAMMCYLGNKTYNVTTGKCNP
jgi:hypothetical protein